MKITRGKLNRRAALLQPTNTTTAINETVVTYAEVGKRWASFLQLLPAEVDREAAPGSKATAKLLVDLDSLTRTVGVRWRIKADGTEYNVIGTDPNPADGSLLLYLAGVQD